MSEEDCIFFDPKSGGCKWQEAVIKPLADLTVKKQRHQPYNPTLYALLERESKKVPSKGTYSNQKAYMDGVVTCIASTREGYVVNPNPTQQRECDRYISDEGYGSQATIINAINQLTAGESLLQLPERINPTE